VATTTTTHVFDDIDEEVRTVAFSVDRARYEIDLPARNHAKLTESLAVCVGHARKTPPPPQASAARPLEEPAAPQVAAPPEILRPGRG